MDTSLLYNNTTTEDIEDRNFYLWMHKHWKISSGKHIGKPFCIDVDGKPRWYIQDILKDTCPLKIIMKCAQSHISEIMVAWSLFLAQNKKGNLGYFFPATTQMNDFVGGRIQPSIDSNPYLKTKITGQYSKGLIQYCNSNLYFRGAKKRTQVISIDCDTAIFMDEVDEIMSTSEIADVTNTILERGNNGIPTRFYDLDGKEVKYIIQNEEKKLINELSLEELLYYDNIDLDNYLKVMMISTPTYENMGIHSHYITGNQQVWQITCDECHQEQELDIFINGRIKIYDDIYQYGDSFDVDEIQYPYSAVYLVCWSCGAKLDRFKKGRYVALNPKSKKSSRTISRLFHPTGNLKKIMMNLHNPMKIKETYNSDLGLPYSPQGGKITKQHVTNLISKDASFIFQSQSSYGTTAGMDVGNNFTLVIRDGNKIIFADEFPTSKEEKLYNIIDAFNVRAMVIDALPEISLVKRIVKNIRKHTKTYRAFYNRNPHQKELFKLQDTTFAIDIMRSEIMSVVMDKVLFQHYSLPNNFFTWKLSSQFVLQLCKPTRILEEQIKTGEIFIIFPKNKPDDWFHALCYSELASELGSGYAKIYNNNLFLRH